MVSDGGVMLTFAHVLLLDTALACGISRHVLFSAVGMAETVI